MPKLAKQGGFTLIELMIVIVILGILLSVALPNFLGAIERSKISAVKANAHTLQTTVEAFAIDWGGIYPNTMEAIESHDSYKTFRNPFTHEKGLADETGKGAWRSNNQGANNANSYNDDAARSLGHTQYTGLDIKNNATTRFRGTGQSSNEPTVNYVIYACGATGEIVPGFILSPGILTDNAKIMIGQ